MRIRAAVGVLAVSGLAASALAQGAAAPRTPVAGPTPPPTVAGYVVTMEITALAPALKGTDKAAPEAQILMGALKNTQKLSSRITLGQDLSRQEILSTDFVLPTGTLVMHKGGEQAYVIADPKTQVFHVMDSAALLTALEGGAGIENSQYDAKVQHTEETKVIAGLPARKSIVTVTYVSSMPLENDRVLVQQKNDVEVWHTSKLVSAAAMDHLFFKFQRDKTGTVRKTLAQEIGFPLEVKFVISSGAGKRAAEVQPGSFHMLVTDVKQDKALDAKLLNIPPLGYRRVERNPYFAAAMAPEKK